MNRLAPVLAVLSLLACGGPPGRSYGIRGPTEEPCECTPGAPWYGTASLEARWTPAFTHAGQPGDNWQKATFSFEHATAEHSAVVNNDWDLLFGNDPEPEVDLFSVIMVTDDQSFIVDLGDKTLAEIPKDLRADDYPTGVRGKHDEVPVVLEHLYLVKTRDSDTEQVAGFFVTAHQPNKSVSIRWVRSSSPDHFAMDWK